MDGVACQNIGNSSRVWYEKSYKNCKLKNPDKFSVNGLGIQSVNGNSVIHFPKSAKTFDIIEFLIISRLANVNDNYTENILNSVAHNQNLDEIEILEVIKNKLADKNEFIEILHEIIENNDLNKEQILKKLRLEIENEDLKNKKKIDALKRNTIFNNLNKTFIKELLQNEKKMIIILDNNPVHHAKLVEKACEILNIELIFLPKYSPILNPIEQVWRTIKKEISHLFIKNENHLKAIFQKTYQNIVDSASFYENWLSYFIT
jgi:transposase